MVAMYLARPPPSMSATGKFLRLLHLFSLGASKTVRAFFLLVISEALLDSGEEWPIVIWQWRNLKKGMLMPLLSSSRYWLSYCQEKVVPLVNVIKLGCLLCNLTTLLCACCSGQNHFPVELVWWLLGLASRQRFQSWHTLLRCQTLFVYIRMANYYLSKRLVVGLLLFLPTFIWRLWMIFVLAFFLVESSEYYSNNGTSTDTGKYFLPSIKQWQI